MKIKVIKDYVDKHTMDIHSVGETVEYEENRAQELIHAGVAEPVKERKKK